MLTKRVSFTCRQMMYEYGQEWNSSHLMEALWLNMSSYIFGTLRDTVQWQWRDNRTTIILKQAVKVCGTCFSTESIEEDKQNG